MSNQNFNVHVQNNTGGTITNVSVIHYCDNATIGNVWSQIENGQEVSLGTAKTFSGHKDYWAIQFAYNGNFYQANCYCSPDSTDTDGYIVLTAANYSIVYKPNGDSCSNKPYTYTTT